MTSDGGVLLLRQADRKLGLLAAVAGRLVEGRDRSRIQHRLVDLLRQRVFGIALAYEDSNDHGTLRRDPAWQTAVERDRVLASPPTLCRFENRADRASAWAIHEVLVERFIAGFARPPAELILDFEATDDPRPVGFADIPPGDRAEGPMAGRRAGSATAFAITPAGL